MLSPPKGFVPLRFFGSRYAWSLFPNPRGFKEGKVEVKVFLLDDAYRKAGQPMEMDYFILARSDLGPCVIFRPKGVEVAHGKRYWVEVTGQVTLQYLVEFVDLNASPEVPKRPGPEGGYLLPLLPLPRG